MVIANTFILWLLGAAALIGVGAVLKKGNVRKNAVDERSTNAAS